MFFGESGSIAGGMMLDAVVAVASRPGRRPGRCQTVASYSSISGCRRAIGAGFGSERSMWQRQIQLRLLSVAPRRSPIGCGSWTMIVSHSPFEALGVERVDLVEQLPLLVAQRLVGSLQRVVEELGRVEELFLAEDHLPVGVEAGVAHQRHDRVEDLRDAAAERGRADVQDAVALERLRERADLLAQLFAGDVGVVGQRLVAEGDFLKHRAEFYRPRRLDVRPAAAGSAARTVLGPRAESDVDLLGFAVLVHHFQRHRIARVRSRRSGWRGRPVRRPCGRRSRGRRRRRCGRGGPGTGSSRRRREARLRRRDRRGRLRRAGRRSRCRGRACRRAAGRAPGSRRRCRRIRPCRRLRAGRSSASRR